MERLITSNKMDNKTILEFTNGKKYVFFKPIFLGGIFLLLLLSVMILALHGFDKSKKLYLNCPIDSQTDCLNPFYDCTQDAIDVRYPCDISNIATAERNGIIIPDFIKKTKFFSKGFTYGTVPPFEVANFPLISLIVIVLCFVINHIIFNLNILEIIKK